jgi:hypothetical protein
MVNLESPFTAALIPDRIDDLGIEQHVALEVPFLGSIFHVLPDFRALGIKGGPIGIRLKWKDVNI